MKHGMGAVLVALVLAMSSSASADDAANKREAQRRFAEGLRAYDLAEFKHDPTMYEIAYQSFARAYALQPDDHHLWNLALSEVDSGRYLKGLGHFRLYDEHARVSEQPTHAKYALLHEYVARAEKETAHLTVDVAAGTPVAVDGQLVGVAPIPVQDLEPGTHVVDGLGQKQEVKIAAGQSVVVKVTPVAVVVPPPVVPPAQASAVVVASTPMPVLQDHTARDVVRWSSSGVAVVALGLGTTFLLDANARARDVDGFRAGHAGACASLQNAACQQTQTMQSRYAEAATVSQVSFVVGAVSAVGAVAAWTVWPSRSVRVVPEAGDRRGALFVTGNF